MHWIESAGGPLLLLFEESLDNWGGVIDLISGPAADIRYSPGGKSTDYDRACSVKWYIGLIDIGKEYGVVLGGEPLQTTWLPYQAASGGMVVRWVFGESESEFLNWIDTIPEAMFRADRTFNVNGPKLLLFDSAVAGRNVKKMPQEYLSIELEPGIYEIKTAIYQPDARNSMVVHRFERCHGVLVQRDDTTNKNDDDSSQNGGETSG